MLKTLAAYAGAVIGAFLLGSILVTQFNLAQVAGMGMDVTLAVRLQATLHDISGLAGTYLPLIAVAFLIALLVATGLLKVFPSQPQLLYQLAGGVALVALHMTMKAVLGLSGIAATRTLAGLLSQGLAGMLGGYIFYRIRTGTADAGGVTNNPA
jgi:hypothetical protein